MFAVVSVSALAARVFVEPTRRACISDADRSAVEGLVKNAVTQNQHTVVATVESAEFVLSPSLMKLGDACILNLQKRNKAGEVVYGEKMKSATMTDMDSVAARLTQSVLKQQSVASTQDFTNVTVDEVTRSNRRVHATRQWIFEI